MNSKTKNIIGWVLSGLLALVFLGSASGKLMGNPEMAKMMGGESNMLLIGIIEVLMVVVFLVPRTGVVGSLLMVAYMGGAMATHLLKGDNIMVQTAIQCLVWITSAIRFPELTKRLFGNEK